MKKVLFVIAFRNFQDEEYLIPKKILKEAGIKTATTSNKEGLAIGVFGETIDIKKTVEEIKIEDYEGIILIGGGGCLPHLDNPISYKLIKKAKEKGKFLAAICISPVVLAKAGVLEDREATVWNSPMDQNSVKILKANNANYKSDLIVKDKKIITARGPEVAEEFGQKIVKLLTKE